MKRFQIAISLITAKLLLLLLLIFFSTHALADTTINKTNVDLIIERVQEVEIKIDTSLSRINKLEEKAKVETKCIPCEQGKVEGGEWIVVFLPGIFFLIIIVIVLKSGLAGFDLKKAMAESIYPTIIIKNGLYDLNNLNNTELSKNPNLQELIPPTIETTYLEQKGQILVPPDPHPSISRYIAFISSILTIVVALGVSCFYLYFYIKTGCPPEISGLSTLLIALGLGVIPYVVNKVSGAIKKNPEQS